MGGPASQPASPAGWTPENPGDRFNELATSLNLRARVHRRTPRRWVYADAGRAAPRVPRDPWSALVCHVLHERLGEPVTLDTLGWTAIGPLAYAPADDGLDPPWTPTGAVAALASVVDADSMERVAEARRRMDDALGGGTLLPAVREDLRLVVAMLGLTGEPTTMPSTIVRSKFPPTSKRA